jgi:pimeloyl-ACP methyl ester carboxylesterase
MVLVVDTGTLLGATYANLFPEKVGRVILDGVVSPGRYFDLLSWVRSLNEDRRATLKAFGDFCDHAKCPLYSEKESAYDRVVRILSKLKQNPLIFRNTEVTGLITYAMLNFRIQNALYKPSTWARLAEDLKKLDDGNSEELGGYVDLMPKLSEFPKHMADHSSGFQAVYYADTDCTKALSEADVRNLLIETNDQLHPLMVMSLHGDSGCSWKTKDNMRYTGPWNKKFANPILLASTKYDPATPLSSAIEALALMNEGGLNNAVLLQQDSVGHCTISQESTCTINAFREYMLHGKLPAPGTVCQPNIANPFILKKGIAPSAFDRLQESFAIQRPFPF